MSISVDSPSDLISKVNVYRNLKGLPSVQEDEFTCEFAQIRAQELPVNFNHSGFRQRVIEAQLPYPTYTRVVENIARNDDATQVTEDWINSEGHAKNLLEDITFACIKNEGNVYAFEGWKP